MKPLSRRSVTTGLAAAVTAIPAVGLCNRATVDPFERIRHLTKELEQAMIEAYGVEVTVLAYDKTAEMKPLIMVVAHTQTECVLVRKSPVVWA